MNPPICCGSPMSRGHSNWHCFQCGAEIAPSPATKETPPIDDYHMVNPRSAESWRLENIELRKRMARALQAIEEILKVEVKNV